MNADSFLLDLHIHTNCSFDCFTKPESIIQYAEKNGLNIVAITDHNSIDNAFKAKEMVNKINSKLKVIVGEEVSTDKGEIIGLFLEKYVRPSNLQNVIENIKSQGGIVYLPHPFKRSEVIRSNIIEYIDIIEIWNARSNYEQNYKALLLALSQNKLMSCGSDSHMISELGRCKMKIYTNTTDFKDEDIKSTTFLNLMRKASEIKIMGTNKNYLVLESISQLVKILKNRTLSPLGYLKQYLPYEFICNKNNPTNIDIMLIKNCDELTIKIRE